MAGRQRNRFQKQVKYELTIPQFSIILFLSPVWAAGKAFLALLYTRGVINDLQNDL